MKIGILCFGPFGGRGMNGSTTVARHFADRLVIPGHETDIIEVPTAWSALLEVFRDGRLENYDAIIGLGEGFDHFVSVEQMAVRNAIGEDIRGETPLENMLPPGPDVRMSTLSWSGRTATENLGLPSGSPGVALNGFDGLFLCNAAHYWLLHWAELVDGRRAGLIHLPSQGNWQDRTGRAGEDYGDVFAAVVVEILLHNGWLS